GLELDVGVLRGGGLGGRGDGGDPAGVGGGGGEADGHLVAGGVVAARGLGGGGRRRGRRGGGFVAGAAGRQQRGPAEPADEESPACDIVTHGALSFRFRRWRRTATTMIRPLAMSWSLVLSPLRMKRLVI